MTDTVSSSRATRTPRRRAARAGTADATLDAAGRRAAGLGLVAVTAAALCGSVLLAPTPASAAPVEPEPEVSDAPALSGDVSYVMAPAGNGILDDGDALTVSFVVDNGTLEALAAVDVSLGLADDALSSRSSLTSWLDGESAARTEEIGTTSFGATLSGAEQTGRLTIDADDEALADRQPGVYPLAATFTVGDDEVEVRSAVTVPDDEGATPLTVIVPITAPAIDTAVLSAAQLEELTVEGGSLASQLDAVAGTPVVLAIDPAILASIRLLGSSAPPSAREWLDDLQALPNARFALQYGDADVTAQVEAGFDDLLEPGSLTALMRDEDFPVPAERPEPDATDTPSPTPSPSFSDTGEADATDDDLPSLEELLDVDAAYPEILWPATGTGGASVADALAGGGDGTPPLLLTASDLVSGGGATASARASATDTQVLVYDSDISRELHAASVQDDTTLRAEPLAAASAYLHVAADDAGDDPLLVTVDRAADARSRLALRAAILAATQAPSTAASTIAGLIATTPAPVQLLGGLPDEERAYAASDMHADEVGLAQFATVLDEPSLLTGPNRNEILQVLGNAWRGEDTWPAVVAEQRMGTTRTIDSVGLLPPSTIQLLGSTSTLPVWVRNDLPYPVNLTLSARPDDLRLDVEDTVTVVASPASNTRIEVPVEARIGNGEVDVALELRSPVGVQIGSAERVEVYVRAEWEGIGITALAILVGGLLIVGLVRTIRHRRRGGPDASAAASDTAPEADR
ncbi:DUF6049 family protein [Microbacterium xanthum]|uniref:DUF6049 family protein n=1 Tax=Microbacterium xanthum TaxID=3079794 RepID=UPI002AD321CF|nr:DUF6049 family protein [Microbacterium sp. KSW-48]MDZ8173129.1 DUF6049 family protein [Microbacterium sp. KSW-48]